MSADLVTKTNNKKYKLVPPDGGWGYMICLAFVIHCSAMSMFIGCFGMLFNDFMIEIKMTSAGVTTLSGIQAICLSFAGFFTAPLLKIASVRQLAMISSLILILGNVGMVFANNTILFIIFQGVFPGASMGLIFNLVCTIMNDYFDKRRLFAFSTVQMLVATITMVGPEFVKWSLGQYGFRGTMILICGINLHTIFGVFLMHPVKWHMRKVEIPDESEMQLLLIDEKGKAVAAVDMTTEKKSVQTNIEEKITLETVENEKSSIMKFVSTFVDISIFKSFVFSCGCLGVSLAAFVDGTYSVIFPQALYADNWKQDDVAFAITLYSFGDLLMRTLLIFTSSLMLKLGSQVIYIIGIVIGIISRLGFLWSQNEIAVYVCIVLIGISKCFIIVLISIVVSDCVAPEQFTQAMGLFMLVSGSIMLILGPVIGFIRDVTDSYSTAFYVLTSLLVIVVLFWSMELYFKKDKQKRKANAEKISIASKK